MGHHATIFMPLATTKQKIDKVLGHGGDHVTIHLHGNTFDEAAAAASEVAKTGAVMVPPFDDPLIIEGQATVGMEIVEQSPLPLDYVFLPVGGGGLAAGVGSYIKLASAGTKIIGVEPAGAASLTLALKHDKPTPLSTINTFVDGAAVRQVGMTNFPLCRDYLDQVVTVDEGHVCSKILQIYNDHGYSVEPAGVLSLCALDLTTEIRNKRVVAIVSGGNSDVFRMPEILERSLIYEEKKHYFRIDFPQRAGALKDFITGVMGPTDDIIYFKYIKLINRELGPVLIGIETKTKEDSYQLMERMKHASIHYEKLTNLSDL
jgi:threonine dehydratase